MSAAVRNRAKKRRARNPEEFSVAESRLGSGASALGQRLLQVIASAFSGGKAFTARELASESGASETSVRKAIAELKRRGFVHTVGHELTNLGRKGALKFVGTLVGEERAQADRDNAATLEGEDLAEAEIRRREALADFLGSRARPGEGPTYRPVLRRLESAGHKLPKITAKRIRGAGYRVCNPKDSGMPKKKHAKKAKRAKKHAAKKRAAKTAKKHRAKKHAKKRHPKSGISAEMLLRGLRRAAKRLSKARKPARKATKKCGNPTLADGAEAWARARGMKLPARGSAAWKGLFTAWQRSVSRLNPVGGSTSYPIPDPSSPVGFLMGSIPYANHYVTATDSFMSGWGPAQNMRNVVVVLARSYAEAQVVAQNLKDRSEMKRVSISASRPKPKAKTLYTIRDWTSWPRYFETGRPFLERKKGNPKKSSRSYRAGKAVRHGVSATARAAKNFWAGLVSKENPQTPQETALCLVAKHGKRGALALARRQEKHARTHGWKSEVKRWRKVAHGVRRIRLGAAAAKKTRRKGNPLSGVVAALNPLARKPLGHKCKWKDAPAAVKRDPLARKAALLAARRHGIPLDEVVGEVCEGPAGTPRHTISSGELHSFSYKTPEGTQHARTSRGARIVFDHKAGDHGRGKKASKPCLLVTDPKTGHPILVSRRGSRPGFSSRRGHTG